MKIINSSVKILPQEKGIVGMLKHIEKVGRISYRSEGRITEDSYEKFVKMLKDRGHWAVFNLGAIYLKFPKTDNTNLIEKFSKHIPFAIIKDNGEEVFVSTDYRVICQEKLEDILSKYWVDPDFSDPSQLSLFEPKITTEWVCSRFVAQQVLRHRAFSPIMESQRYVNYSLDKNELCFIMPEWMKKKENSYLKDDPASVDNMIKFWKVNWKEVECRYKLYISQGLKPEDARGCLPMDTACKFAFSGFLKDWVKVPDPDSAEKVGFFYLRCAKDAQEDVRVLALDLQEQFKEYFKK
jgi:hypothetical protein